MSDINNRTVLKAMDAASELISEDLRQNFLIVGGAALICYGSDRKTRDVDIAITSKTLSAFMEKAGADFRFSSQPDGTWTYICQDKALEDLIVGIEFLEIGGEVVPRFHGTTQFDSVWVASLADIALMKAHAFQDRGQETDMSDLEFALNHMVKRGETFKKYRFKRRDIEIISKVVEGKDDAELKGILELAT